MQKQIFFRLLASSFFLTFFIPGIQAQVTNPAKDTLTVGVAGSEPFVIKGENGENPSGVAVEIWEDLAAKKGWPYRYRPFNNVESALGALDGDSLDLVAGPISITAKRVENMRFSQPYYQSSLTIVSRAEKPDLWETIKPLFSFKLLIAVGVFLIILAIVGTLLWFAERKQSPEQFPTSPVNGIGNGMWLALVTMTTVGYGDKAPTTLAGRIIAGSWMVISIIFATSMVAGIASTLTLSALGSSTITDIDQLTDKKAATISGSPAEGFLKDHQAAVIEVENLSDAFVKLKNKEVDAVVYDRPQLLYFLQNNKNEGLHIANAEYYKQGYGFAFPLNSDLVYPVNRTLLELAEDQSVEKIIDDYLGKEE